MNVIATPRQGGGRVSMKEINVIGTMQLLAACQKAPTVRRLVVKSTAGVYGSSPRDPALFTEDTGAKVLPRGGWGKDSVEVEGYVRGFSRRRPDVDVAMLRFANFIGPNIRTALTDYFSLPVVPTVLGFDGRLQFVHEDDGRRGPPARHDGPDDRHRQRRRRRRPDAVAGRAGSPAGRRCPVPPALSGVANTLFRRTGLTDFSPDQIRFLSYGRGLDTTRMRCDLGLEPRVHDPGGLRRLRPRTPAARTPLAGRRAVGRGAAPRCALRGLVPTGEAS